MKLKRFVAADSSKAMRKIKDAFGDDAVILSSHSVKDGIEIVAAVDYDESVINQSLTEQEAEPIKLPAATAYSKNISPVVSQTNHQPRLTSSSEVDSLREDVRLLRELIENQLSGFAWQHISHYQPIKMMLIKRLTKLGFDINIAEKLVKPIEETQDGKKAWLTLLSKILTQINQPSIELLSSEGAYAFVGPTGVGKTTTIAKLAAQYCLNYGAENLGIIALDSYRIAAVEQLITYGKILGVSVSIAHNQQTLQTAIQKLSHKKLILIDTAGMNPKDQRVNDLFAMLENTALPIHPVLLFSASSQYHVLEKLYAQYTKYEINQCIITKIDEAEEIGAILSLLINHNIAVGYLTNGQRVPEDIIVASNQNILKELIQSQNAFSSEINMNELIASLSGSNVYA